MNTQCLCEHPNIILNPNARDFILRDGAFYFRDTVPGQYKLFRLNDGVGFYSRQNFYYNFPRRFFSARLKRITVDEVEKICSVNLQTGETTPIYMVVPCGKCDLCLHRKRKEWAFRCACETYTNGNIPFFVTLTYNDGCLPSNGCNKDDVQRFLKRLRSKLVYIGADRALRYVCVSEYGKNGTHRPHYHLLLWNLPQDYRLSQVVKLIRETWKYGFVTVKPCTQGGVTYVLKYMSKHVSVPKGKNECFFTASRGRLGEGGIGFAYCEQMREYILKNPDLVTLSVLDLSTGKKVTCGLPQYFKRRIFKTKSQLVSKEIRDTFEKLCVDIACRNLLWVRLRSKRNYMLTLTTTEECKILSKFHVICPCVPPKVAPAALDFDYKGSTVHDCWTALYDFQQNVYLGIEKLKSFDLSCLDKVLPAEHLREVRKMALSVLQMQEIDVNTYASNVKECNRRREIRRKL